MRWWPIWSSQETLTNAAVITRKCRNIERLFLKSSPASRKSMSPLYSYNSPGSILYSSNNCWKTQRSIGAMEALPPTRGSVKNKHPSRSLVSVLISKMTSQCSKGLRWQRMMALKTVSLALYREVLWSKKRSGRQQIHIRIRQTTS